MGCVHMFFTPIHYVHLKPPGWIMCPHCHGTTYLFERVDDEKSRMLFVKCTNPKCKEGFISFDEAVTKN